MATSSLAMKYRSAIRKLFPPGKAFDFIDGSTGDKFYSAMAEEVLRVELRGQTLLNELDPRVTFEMLDSWERLLGIPDECTPEDQEFSIAQRRARVLQKLTTGGGQTKAFYKLIAAQLGYDVEALDVVNFRDFRAGISRAGEVLSNASNGEGEATSWPFTYQIKAPAMFVRRFTASQSTAGERLVVSENQTLECVIRKFAPAHVTVLFSYGD